MTVLYEQHYRALVRLSALLVRDSGTAEEVVQDAFVAMHAAWRRITEPDQALAYLRRSVVNGSRSVLRRRAVADRHPLSAGPAEPSAERAALARLAGQRLADCLRRLPARQREALVLRYYADLSEAEIADVMQVSRGAVKSHTARGRDALRTMMAGWA